MKSFLLIALFVLAQPGVSRADGNESAHGGDGVYCTASDLNSFQGFYMLDFLLMRGYGPGAGETPFPDEIRQMTDYRDVLGWIQGELDQKLPVLGSKFRDFRSTLFATDPSLPRRWLPVSDLSRVYDQGLGSRYQESENELRFRSRGLPINCPGLGITQVAVRFQNADDGTIVYAYVPALFQQLAEQQALQASFLIVHEWLRDFTEDPEVIRRSNRLMHSVQMQNWGHQQLLDQFKAMGLVWW